MLKLTPVKNKTLAVHCGFPRKATCVVRSLTPTNHGSKHNKDVRVSSEMSSTSQSNTQDTKAPYRLVCALSSFTANRFPQRIISGVGRRASNTTFPKSYHVW